MSTRSNSTPPGAREKTWSRVANIALIIGALITAYLVYLAFAKVY